MSRRADWNSRRQPGELARAFPVADRRGDRHAAAGASGGDLGQDEQPRRPGDHQTLRSQARGCRSTSSCAVCCLRPRLPECPANIRVKPIVGCLLEHSRIFVFANGKRLTSCAGRGSIFSSADWMPRNFDRRVEYMMPLENPTVRQCSGPVMIANLIDNEQSWEFGSDGRYQAHGAGQAPLQPPPLFHDQSVAVGPRRVARRQGGTQAA